VIFYEEAPFASSFFKEKNRGSQLSPHSILIVVASSKPHRKSLRIEFSSAKQNNAFCFFFWKKKKSQQLMLYTKYMATDDQKGQLIVLVRLRLDMG
jgi:hypothetical protein